MEYGLIGTNLSYSYSKIIHEKLASYEYDLVTLPKSNFESFISNKQYKGLTVTIPYKKDVIPYCHGLTKRAKEIGAINTLFFVDSELWGHNTDYDGFLYMARRAGIDFKSKRVLVLGDGGTSLTVRTVLKHEGASEIMVASRKSLESELKMRGEKSSASEVGSTDKMSSDFLPKIRFVAYEDLPSCSHADIIINTTPVGTWPGNGIRLVDLDNFPNCTGVLDVIYNPFLTDLLIQGKKRGLAYSGGLPMLVAQAAYGAALFTNQLCLKESPNQSDVKISNQEIEVSIEDISSGNFTIPNELLSKIEVVIGELEYDLKNVILVGMPGSGKSTIGKALGQILNREFIDLDEMVESSSGMSIPKIFEQFGEGHFRKLEAEATTRVGMERGKIIATGGGTVLLERNRDALLQNGHVIFLERKLSNLSTRGRPLSTGIEALHEIYEQRLPLYKSLCDYIIDTDKNSTKESVSEILLFLGGNVK